MILEIIMSFVLGVLIADLVYEIAKDIRNTIL